MSIEQARAALEKSKAAQPKGGTYEESTEFKFKDEGDTLEGTFVRQSSVKTRYGMKTVVEIRAADGTLYSTWPTPALVEKLHGVVPGQSVAIALVELVPTDKGNPFKQFAVGTGPAPAGTTQDTAPTGGTDYEEPPF